MSRNLTDISSDLVSKLLNNNLTRGDLSSYIQNTDSKLKEVYSFKSISDFKNASTPFLVMLSNSDFTNNDYLWQTICGRAYFIASYHIQVNILDDYVVPKPEMLIDYVELLKVRLLILLNGKLHFPELVFKIPNNPNTKYWSPLSSMKTEDKEGFETLMLSDAGLILKYASNPLIKPIHQEAIEFANSVIRDKSNILRNSSIEEKINQGRSLHRLFFNYLNKLLETNNKIDFHNDDDDDDY